MMRGMTQPPLPPPGWYADPAGSPHRVRWWDGAAWTSRVRRTGRRPGRWPWALAGVALALVMIGLAAWPTLTGGQAGPATPGAPATRSGAARPAATPTFASTPSLPPKPAPTISAEAPSQGPQAQAACRSGSPDFRQQHPQVPGEVTGGGLTVTLAGGWRPANPPRLPFGNDMGGAVAGPNWLAVGAIRAEQAEFASPGLAARSLVGCLEGLPGLPGLAEVDQRDVPVTITGAREAAGVLAHLGPAEGKPSRTALVVVADTSDAESMPFVVVVGGYEGPRSDDDLLGWRDRIRRA